FLFVVFPMLARPVAAQILGGTSPGQQLPTEVAPTDLAGSAFGGDVNLFTGSYQGSYALGTVATPGGLAFTLQLQNSSAITAGTDVPVANGIPYGEGWSLNIPTVSVTSEAYHTYTNLCMIHAGNLDTATYALNEGDLYWFAPTVSIPGVVSGRAVYKYTDNRGALFVLNTFDRYVEIRLAGDRWEVSLDDGTTYRFDLARTSYRQASNQRGFIYGAAPQPQGQPLAPDKMNGQSAVVLENLVKPKGEFLQWYCTEVNNPSLPLAQRIQFLYETYGHFNYFKEYSENHQSRIAQSLREEFSDLGFQVTPSGDTVWNYAPFNLPDL
ncbi:MAG: hypothetical protein AAGB22_04505, partial [Bacteroidota bacterium]